MRRLCCYAGMTLGCRCPRTWRSRVSRARWMERRVGPWVADVEIRRSRAGICRRRLVCTSPSVAHISRSLRYGEVEAHHLRQTPGRNDVSSMHQSVQMSSTLLNLLAHIIVDLHVENIGDEIESILIVLYFRVKASQVEAIC
jgi:hypothetical protein